MGGGDKCLRPLGGRPILAQVIERARPQVETLVLNANGDPARFASLRPARRAGRGARFRRPARGVLTGLEWAAAHRPGCAWVAELRHRHAVLPCRPRRAAAGRRRRRGCASSPVPPAAGRPIRCSGCGRWRWRASCGARWSRRACAGSTPGPRAIAWPLVEFPVAAVDPFFNANRPEDLAQAERLLADG